MSWEFRARFDSPHVIQSGFVSLRDPYFLTGMG
jgi:hypothetical protein